MKFLHIGELHFSYTQLPNLWAANGVQYPVRELWNKGYVADVNALGWQGVEPTMPDYNPETHKIGDAVYNVENGKIVGQYQIVPLSAEELAAGQDNKRQADKLTGVEFEGVMCSATAEDMWGLSAIKEWVAAGQTANFKFENGNTLAITPENYAAFQAVWVPFRASFF